MNKVLLTFVCCMCHGCCLTFNSPKDVVDLDRLIEGKKNVREYFKIVGMLDASIEEALIAAAGCKAGVKASIDYEKRGRDVLEEHNTYERIANDAYQKEEWLPFESTASGLPHALGKHMQFLDKRKCLNHAFVIPTAWDCYKYMQCKAGLLDLHDQLVRNADTTEKSEVTNVIMKYAILNNVIRNANAFMSSEYERNGYRYTGLAFFTDEISYNSGMRPIMLFVPIRHQSENREACVCSAYPLNSEKSLACKLNYGAFISKDDVKFKLSDVPASFASLISWSHCNIASTVRVEPNAHSSTHGAEQKQYKAKYENLQNFKIRTGNNIYDVIPYDGGDASYELAEVRASALEQMQDFVSVCKAMCIDVFEKEDEISKKYRAIIAFIVDWVECFFHSEDKDLLRQIYLCFRGLEKDKAFSTIVYGLELIEFAKKAIQEANCDNKKQTIATQFFPTKEKARQHIISCGEKLADAVLPSLFERVCRSGAVKLFVECFLPLVKSGILDLYPEISEYLCNVNHYGKPIKAIAILNSPKFKSFYRKQILQEIQTRKELNQQLEALCSLVHSRCNNTHSILFDAILANLEFPEQLLGIIECLCAVASIPGEKIAESILQWMKEELRDSRDALRCLVNEFLDVNQRVNKVVAKLSQTKEGEVVCKRYLNLYGFFPNISDIAEQMRSSLQIIDEQLVTMNEKQTVNRVELSKTAKLLDECRKRLLIVL